jgi:hypothetical protein
LKAASGTAAAGGSDHRLQQGPADGQGDYFSLDDVMQGAGISTAAAAAGGASMKAGVNPLSRRGLAGTTQQQQPPPPGFVSAASLASTKAAAGGNAVSGDGPEVAAAAGELDAGTGAWRVKQPASRGNAAARTQPAGFSSGSRLTAGTSRALAGNGHVNGGRKDPAAALAQELKAVDDSDDDFM